MAMSKVDLYEKVKKIIWVLKLTWPGDEKICTFTGFTVAKEEDCNAVYIMTAAHEWSQERDVKIQGRRLTSSVFHSLIVESYNTNWAVALLKLENDVEGPTYPLGNLTEGGSLEVGNTLMSIGHTSGLIGSLLSGFVCYPCVKDLEITKGGINCGIFDMDRSGIPLKYRMMGDVWNTKFFTRVNEKFEFERQLQANVQIIQIREMGCGEGTWGAPIVNCRGEIVGMVVRRFYRYDIGVHVTLLRQFMKNIGMEPKVGNQ